MNNAWVKKFLEDYEDDCSYEPETIPSTIETLEKVTRVEVIDDKGRSYVNRDDSNAVQISMQDNERTLKIFIGTKK